jgi:hypothetical protein
MFKLGIQESIIDPKVGLSLHGPLDFNTRRRRFSNIRLGLICKDVSRIKMHLFKLNNSFPFQKTGDRPYRGFEKIYKLPITFPTEAEATSITDSEISRATVGIYPFKSIVRLYDSKIQEFHDRMRGSYDILIIQIPKEFSIYDNPLTSQNLYPAIKALAIRRQITTQILTEKTLTYRYDCDNMWNLSVGLYAKAGGVPWKLKEFTHTKSFIGIAYGIKKTEAGQAVLLGLAQIFDEFGEHVSMMSITSEAFGKDFVLETDGSYHLSEEKIAFLVERLIEEYKRKIGNPPEKVVIHKTSFFNEDEKKGIKEILSKSNTGSYDLIYVMENSSQRLFSSERIAPARGTFWKIDKATALLYTTGYVQSLGTYPGIGIPKPIEFHVDEGSSKLETIGKEILALTKMDWNNTAFMNREPVTTKYASRIVEVLKAGLQPDEVVKDIGYYM